MILGTQDTLQDWGQLLVQEGWCFLPDCEKGLRLSPGLMFRPSLSLLQGHCLGPTDVQWGFSGGPEPYFRASYSMMFRREGSGPSRLPARPP